MTSHAGSDPTEAQVEAAAKSLARSFGTRIDVIPEWLDGYVEIARAALAAARGAAPQADHNDLIAKTFNEIHGDLRSFSHAEVKQFVYPLIDALRAPALPSSGVDEAALIREAKAEAWDEGYWQGINGHTGPGNPYEEPNATPYREGSET